MITSYSRGVSIDAKSAAKREDLEELEEIGRELAEGSYWDNLFDKLDYLAEGVLFEDQEKEIKEEVGEIIGDNDLWNEDINSENVDVIKSELLHRAETDIRQSVTADLVIGNVLEHSNEDKKYEMLAAIDRGISKGLMS